MPRPDPIPVFALFGETEPFPDIVHVERISDRAQGHGWVIRPHRHQKMAQLLLMQQGEAEAQFDGVTREMQPGAFLFLPAGVVHGFAFAPGTEGHVLSFPLTVLASLGPAREEIESSLGRPVHGHGDTAMQDIALLLERTLATPGRFRAQSALGLAHAILAGVAEAAIAQGRTPGTQGDRMAQFDWLIAEHLGDGWQPKEFAKALGVTTGQLSRICRAAHGVGARAYLDAALMTEAARNLAFTRLPVSEIGYRLGFADPTHFSRRFRTVVGSTPTQYRRQTDVGTWPERPQSPGRITAAPDPS